MSPSEFTFLLALAVLLSGVHSQLDASRSHITAENNRQTEIPSVSAIFSSLLPTLHDKDPSSSPEEVTTLPPIEKENPQPSSSSENTTNPNPQGDFQPSVPVVDNPEHPVSENPDFQPLSRVGSSTDGFQSRSGLINDFDDTLNNFGERIMHDQAAETSEASVTLPTLYLRDQPEELTPFEDVKTGLTSSSGPPTAEWQPNWPTDLVLSRASGTVRPTSRQTDSDIHVPEPTTIEFPVEKEPITQYFFDLTDAAIPSSKIPGPLHDRTTTGTVSLNVVPTAVPSANVSAGEGIGGSLGLQSSVRGAEETTSASPSRTPDLDLSTGLEIDQIYSSAFFPSSPTVTTKPSSISIGEVRDDLEAQEDGNVQNESSDSILTSPTVVSSGPSSSVEISSPIYSLGSNTDYLFSTSAQSAGGDTKSNGIGEVSSIVPGVSLLKVDASSASVQPDSSLPSVSLPLDSTSLRFRSGFTRNKLASKTRVASNESRKPLWMLLSKPTDPSSITPFLSDLETDFPVGILSNRLPLFSTGHKTLLSSVDLTSHNLHVLETSSVLSSGLPSHFTSINIHPSHIIPAVDSGFPTMTVSSFTAPASLYPSSTPSEGIIVSSSSEIIDQPSFATPDLQTDASTSMTANDLMPSPSLTGGFIPILPTELAPSSVFDNAIIHSVLPSTAVNVTATLHSGFAPIAPTSIVSQAVDTLPSHRFELESAFLHNVPDTIVTRNQFSSTQSISPVDPATIFENEFTFGHTPSSQLVVPTVTQDSPSVTLGVTPKSSGSSGFDETLRRRSTPFPIRVGVHHSLSDSTYPPPTTEVNDLGDVDERTNYRRQPTTYVYPEEFLATEDFDDVESVAFVTDDPQNQTEENLGGSTNTTAASTTQSMTSTTPSTTPFTTPSTTSSTTSKSSTTPTSSTTPGTPSTTTSTQKSTTSITTSTSSTTTSTSSTTTSTSSTTSSTPVSFTTDMDLETSSSSISSVETEGPETVTESVLIHEETKKASTMVSNSAAVTEKPANGFLDIEDTEAPVADIPEKSTLPPTTTTTTTTTTTAPASTTTTTPAPSSTTAPTDHHTLPHVRLQVSMVPAQFCSERPGYTLLMKLWLLQSYGLEQPLLGTTDIQFFGAPDCDAAARMSSGDRVENHLSYNDNNLSVGENDLPVYDNSLSVGTGLPVYDNSLSVGETGPPVYESSLSVSGNNLSVDRNDVSVGENGLSVEDAPFVTTDGPRALRLTGENLNLDSNNTSRQADEGKGSVGSTTNAFFYVTRDGQYDKLLTEGFPLFPQTRGLPLDLQHLADSVVELELVQPEASSVSAPPAGGAAGGLGTAGVVGVVVCVLLLLCCAAAGVAFALHRRRQAAARHYGRRCTPVSMDAYSVDSVSVYHSFRRKSKRNRSSRSVKSYLNQGFEDPTAPSRPLDFAQLTHFISDMDGVHAEFGDIPTVTPAYGDLPPNVQDKNRYANVVPLNETRVLLRGHKGDAERQYINANFVQGPRAEAGYYIATQAPLEHTVGDLWRLVWEQEVRVLVMLTDFVERGIDKCADYLPPSQTLDCHRVYGDFQVTLKSRDMQEQFVVSSLLLKNLENNLTRDVTHMWYTGWPVTGVPHAEKPFISFVLAVRRARKLLRAKGPVLVHCSPGTGRTGTYIAIDSCLKQYEEQRTVDIPTTVYNIRRDRAGAVQTSDQYAFIYRVVNLFASKLSSGSLDSL